MPFIRIHYKIILMIAVLITVPILLSVLATQYEACKFIKKDCIPKTSPLDYVNPDELTGQFLDEVVCQDSKPEATKPIYKDLNTGKCYGFVEGRLGPGSSPPPPNARLVWIGSGRQNSANPSYQDYKENPEK